MSEWKELKIEDFCEVIGGGTPSTKEDSYYGGDISWITPRDLTNYKNRFISRGERNISDLGLKNSSAKILPKNSILLTSRAPIGYLAIAENEVCTNQGFKSLIVDAAKADYNFVYYLIKSNVERIKGLGTGTTFAEISGSVVKGLKFTLPDLPTQTAIVEILSSLDDKIELNNKINQELETLAQTLFKQWFIEFEFPNENGEPYKSSGGEMVDSALGEIPKGWNMKTLDDISNITIGRTPPRKEHQWFSTDVNDVKWISIRDMGNCGTYIHTTSEFLTEDAVSRFNVPVINSNTVIISFKLTVGRISITTERMLSNEAIAHLNLKNKEIYPEFLYLFLKQFNFDSLGSTSSIATAVNSKSIKSLPFINPSKEVLSKFNEVIVPLFSRIHNLTFENKELVDLRDTLLPKLISGELEINEIKN
jgi:type I restriction enzyme, S subunit